MPVHYSKGMRLGHIKVTMASSDGPLTDSVLTLAMLLQQWPTLWMHHKRPQGGSSMYSGLCTTAHTQ